jgi:two-component system, OmpR family, phosphate regulon sensor histidine kinase PhoR
VRLRADQRLFLSYLALIVGLVVTLLFGIERLLRESLLEMVQGDLGRELELARELYETAGSPDADSIADLIGTLSGRRTTIIAPDGSVIGESSADGPALEAMENHAARPEVLAAATGGEGRSIRGSTTVGERLLYLAARTRGGDVLRLAEPLTRVDEPVARLQRGVMAAGAIAIGLSALFSLGFSVAVTKPLRRIEAAARAMARGDLSVRLRERRRDEFGEVARALDALAGELQRRMGELEEEQARTRVLIDTMSEGVIALGPDGSVVRANPAAQQMFSLPERLPVSTPEAVSRRSEFRRIVRRALDGESIPPTELSAEGRALLATAQPLPDGGAVVVILDISELRRLEDVRRDFVANASHELKTPLTAIRGYSETLLDPELPPDLVRRFATVMHANADRLQRIVDDLLDLSRIETGGWVAYSEVVSIEEVARDVWSETLRSAGERRLDFKIRIGDGAGEAFCDPAALRQIFSNLFSNAIRYTPDGGGVQLVVERVPPRGSQRAGEWLRLSVRDTGSGIPAVHLPRIFERFYRVDPARSREEGGTGLGLAIVKHLVEAHGGAIEAESTLGGGTAIRFTLPSCDSSAPGGGELSTRPPGERFGTFQ